MTDKVMEGNAWEKVDMSGDHRKAENSILFSYVLLSLPQCIILFRKE